jgi:hypothetical protein
MFRNVSDRFRTGRKYLSQEYHLQKTYFNQCSPVLSLKYGQLILYRAVFLNRRAVARYRAVAPIMPGRKNLSF